MKLFYRLTRAGGSGIPLAIVHGANYYDSSDWSQIARRLAVGRDVLTYDVRGFGASTWSTVKDYSYDAHVGDLSALLDHLGIREAVVAGHSRGGAYALVFAARSPHRTRGLVLLDYLPPRSGATRTASPAPGKPREIFATADEALAATSRSTSAPGAIDRLAARLEPVSGGFAFRRDPDWGTLVPTVPGWRSTLNVVSLWSELERVESPVRIVRGARSDRCPEDVLAALPPSTSVETIAAGHDLAADAPDALIATLERYLVALEGSRPHGNATSSSR